MCVCVSYNTDYVSELLGCAVKQEEVRVITEAESNCVMLVCNNGGQTWYTLAYSSHPSASFFHAV